MLCSINLSIVKITVRAVTYCHLVGIEVTKHRHVLCLTQLPGSVSGADTCIFVAVPVNIDTFSIIGLARLAFFRIGMVFW